MNPDLFPAFFVGLSFLFGSCIGSFLNVCIWRIPCGGSIVLPSSHCPCCGTPIPWHCNIPLVSWSLLRRRCHYCCCKISVRYILIEAMTGIMFAMSALAVRWPGYQVPAFLTPLSPTMAIVMWIAYSGLIVATFVDIDWMIIPDRISLGGIAAGLLLSAAVPEIHSATTALGGIAGALTGAALGYALLMLISHVGRLLFKREAMGYGDVKLLAAIGAFFGWRCVLFSVVAGSFIGSTIGVTLIIRRGREWGSRMPFGPCLALAAVLWTFWGPAIVRAYTSLLQP